MPTNFPTGIDTFTAKKVIDLEDALEAVEAKLGVNGSADATTVDKKLATLTTDVALKADTAAVVLKSLVDAKGDLFVGTAADTVGRLAAGARSADLVADSTQAAGVRWLVRQFNVRAFGATGDGVTDDRVAIQAAIDAAKDAVGGEVVFPQGTYMIGPGGLTMPASTYSGITLRGLGMPTIKAMATLTAHNLLLAGNVSAVSNLTIIGIKFDDNGSARGSVQQNLIYLRGSGSATVRDCVFVGLLYHYLAVECNAKVSGCDFSGTGTATNWSSTYLDAPSRTVRLTDCRFFDAGASTDTHQAVYANAAGHLLISSCAVENCSGGFDIRAGITRALVVGCTVIGGTAGSTGSGNAPFMVWNADTQIVGCKVFGWMGNTTVFRLLSTATKARIIGCTVRPAATPPTNQSVVRISGGSGHAFIGNDFEGLTNLYNPIFEVQEQPTDCSAVGNKMSATFMVRVTTAQTSVAMTFTANSITALTNMWVNETNANGSTAIAQLSFGTQRADSLRMKEGSNAKQGVATLASGTVTVANTSVTANSRIILTPQTLGTITRPQALGVTARTAGTSFTVMSADATDTSTFAYEIFEPA